MCAHFLGLFESSICELTSKFGHILYDTNSNSDKLDYNYSVPGGSDGALGGDCVAVPSGGLPGGGDLVLRVVPQLLSDLGLGGGVLADAEDVRAPLGQVLEAALDGLAGRKDGVLGGPANGD